MELKIPGEKDVLKNIEREELQNIENYLNKLYAVWEDFGINIEQKVQRSRVVWKHVKNLLQDISNEEVSFYEDVKERIRNYTIKIDELAGLLSVTPKEQNSTSLIKKEENLRLELDNLSKLKHKRIKSYQDLKMLESPYCSLLGMAEHQLSTDSGIPSEKDLHEINQHIAMLKAERDRRYKKLCNVKKELSTILEVTELTPETPLEKEILSKSDTVSLTNETLKALEEVVCKAQKRKQELENQKNALVGKLTELWNRLKVPDSEKREFLSKHVDFKVSTLSSIKKELERCEKIKKDNIKMYVDNLRQELKQMWDKCYASESEKSEFKLYNSEEMTDHILEAHEAEVQKWKVYYEEIKHIATKIEKRKRLWDLLLVFESKGNDPNRFKNRKGNLLKEEKERKRLQKDLPALETEIYEEIDMYEGMKGKSFKYFDEDFRKYIETQWQERSAQKENEKQERKLRLLDRDTMMLTPGKRPLSATPRSAPSKMFKSSVGMSVHNTPLTPKGNKISSVGRSVLATSKFLNSPHKTPLTIKLFPGNSSRPNFILKKDQKMLKEISKSKSDADSTTYSAFSKELNSTKRRSFRSSVISTKKVGGTRISNTSRNKRKSPSKPARKSSRNTSKTTTNLTPARGKLGLPFLI